MALGSQGNLNPQLLVLILKLIQGLGEMYFLSCFLTFSTGHRMACCTGKRSQFMSMECIRMRKEFLRAPLLAGSFRFLGEALKGKA